MDNVKLLLSGIQFKTRKLAEEVALLRQDKAFLESEQQKLIKEIEKQKTVVKQLEEKIHVLSIAQSIDTGENSLLLKKKINEVLREIDKCIGLMDK
jgi:ClpP class serine protease